MIKSLFEAVERCLMEETQPSKTLQAFLARGEFKTEPFALLALQQHTEQSPQHHPEGSVWNHTLLVVDEAALCKGKSTDPRAFMWAALLHDIGKPATTRVRKGKITAYDHDRIGAGLARDFLSACTRDEDFINRVTGLVRYHMQVLYVINDLPFQDIEGMKQTVGVKEVALLGLCDRLGRTGSNRAQEEEKIRRFLEKCS